MSEFLFIVPGGWTQIDLPLLMELVPDAVPGAIDSWILTEQYTDLTTHLKTAQMIDETLSVAEAKLIDATYLMVRLV